MASLAHLRQGAADQQSVFYRLSVAKEVGSDGSAASGGGKRPERVAAVGEGRRCTVTEDIRRAPQQFLVCTEDTVLYSAGNDPLVRVQQGEPKKK